MYMEESKLKSMLNESFVHIFVWQVIIMSALGRSHSSICHICLFFYRWEKLSKICLIVDLFLFSLFLKSFLEKTICRLLVTSWLKWQLYHSRTWSQLPNSRLSLIFFLCAPKFKNMSGGLNKRVAWKMN